MALRGSTKPKIQGPNTDVKFGMANKHRGGTKPPIQTPGYAPKGTTNKHRGSGPKVTIQSPKRSETINR